MQFSAEVRDPRIEELLERLEELRAAGMEPLALKISRTTQS